MEALMAEERTNAVTAKGGPTAQLLEYLVFRLASEEYGIDIQKVQELRGYESVTHIANAPEFIKGVINLRGVIVPIIDMRIRFSLGTPTYDQFTVVVVLNMGGRVVGMVVDSVSDVVALKADDIRPPPELGGAMKMDYVTGIGTLDQRMLILVDIEQLMSDEEIGLIAKLAA